MNVYENGKFRVIGMGLIPPKTNVFLRLQGDL